MAEAANETEQREEKSPEDISKFWQGQLALADKDQGDWVKDARSVVSRYRAEAARRGDNRKFNILFSNTETLKASLYGRSAKPDVRRRFADKDPVARTAAEVVERGLIYCAESYDVDKPIEKALHDHLLPGRGVLRIEYEPIIKERPSIDPMTAQPMMGEDGQPAMEKFIADQVLMEKYVYWEDYRQCPARIWDDVWWIGFRHLMTRDELISFFESAPQGSKPFCEAKEVPLNWSPDTEGKKEIAADFKKAEVWELWDRTKAERVWIVKGFEKPLRLDQDPYGLEDFYPLPEPLRSIEDTDTLVPTPEFNEYRDQADALDEITSRIDRLTKALKRRGVYDKSMEALRRLARAGDNEFIAVDNWTELSTKGGLEAKFQTENIEPIAKVLKELYVQRDQLIQGIYEVTGIADIMRGSSDPSETLGAQQLKAQFGSTRLKKRQRAIQKWLRDIYKLKAEIIAEHFEPEVLSQMTGQQVTPEVIQLLRSDKLRSYRIDIETDSTIFEDAEAQKKATVEMLTAVGGFLKEALPAATSQPALAPLLFEMLSIGLRTFKEGKKLEDVVEQTKDALTQAAQQPKPDPEQQKVEAEMKRDEQSHQMDMQTKQVDLQVHQAKAQTDMQKLQFQTQNIAQRAMIPQPQGQLQ
jgi:hypothetical protein